MSLKLTREQQRLVETHIDLAHKLAKAYWSKYPEKMDLREVTSVAYQGLVTAAARYNPDFHGENVREDFDPFLAFGPYARTRINGAILDWAKGGEQDHVPRRQRRAYKDFQSHGHGGVGRTASELSDLTGMPEDKVRAIILAVESTAISLDGPPDTWEGIPHNNDIASHADVESSAVQSAITRAATRALRSLTNFQQVVVILRYYQGYELPAIAEVLQVRLPLVREAHTESMIVIHSVMEKEAS